MTDDLQAILPRLSQRLHQAQPRPLLGRLLGVRGLVIQASLPGARVGDQCELLDPHRAAPLPAEVVGLDGAQALLAPAGSLEGLSRHTAVRRTGRAQEVAVGEALLGRVVDAFGAPLDGGPAIAATALSRWPLRAAPPAPFAREPLERPLSLGVRAIDGLLSVAQGQRLGIFGEPGVGKSSLLGSVMRHCQADVLVIGLIGERGREVRDFIEGQLDATSRARTVAVVATAERPAAERVRAALMATAQAEYHRAQGRHVLLLIDSLTRFARAQRELGLAAGEPPTRRGYPPSCFASLPALLERAGATASGSVTALYSVLTEGEADLDPIAEEVRSLLDGHLVLSATLAQRNHFPAIDILRSRSRLMERVVTPQQSAQASRIRALLARHADLELVLATGDYSPGSDALSDEAIARRAAIEAFLQQRAEEPSMPAATWRQLAQVLA